MLVPLVAHVVSEREEMILTRAITSKGYLLQIGEELGESVSVVFNRENAARCIDWLVGCLPNFRPGPHQPPIFGADSFECRPTTGWNLGIGYNDYEELVIKFSGQKKLFAFEYRVSVEDLEVIIEDLKQYLVTEEVRETDPP